MFRIWGHYDGKFITITPPLRLDMLEVSFDILPLRDSEFIIYEG